MRYEDAKKSDLLPGRFSWGEVSLRVRLLWQWGWLNFRHGLNTLLHSADDGRQDHTIAYGYEHNAGDVNEAELFVSFHEEVDEATYGSNEDGEYPPKSISAFEGFDDGHDITNEANDASNE